MTTAATASPARTAIGTGTLSLKFPANYHRALGVVRQKVAAGRRPAYVNPTTGNVLDIYVSGTLVLNLDGQTPNDSVTVAPTGSGAQTITNVPLYSTTSDIAVIEREPVDSFIVALGELPSVAVTAGGTTNITLTMLMNVTGFAIAPTINGSVSTVIGGQNDAIGSAGTPSLVYIYPTDELGGYTSSPPTVGNGGLPTNMTVTGSATDGSKIGAEQFGYLVNYASSNSRIPISVTATNPAWFIGNNSSFPELNALFQSNYNLFNSLLYQQVVATMTLVPGLTGFHEYALPTQSAGALYSIVAGPDGNLWGTENGASKIYKLTTSGSATEYATPTSNAAPISIVSGSDGNLWFDEFNAGNVASVVPGTAVISEYALPSGSASGPVAMGASPAGTIWVVDYRCSVNALTEFTPMAYPAFSQYAIPQGCSAPNGMAFDSSNNAWFFEQNQGVVLNSSPTGTFSNPIQLSSGANSIATGSDGNLWMTESSYNAVARVTPAGVLTEFQLNSIGGSLHASPNQIAPGPNNTMLITEPGINAVAIMTLTPTPSVTEMVIPTPNVGLDAITLGPDGNIWFTEDYNNTRSYVGVIAP